MPKLNQIIAIEKGVKNNVGRELTDAYHALQKPALLTGISRTYRPKDDDGEKLPAEHTRVQVNARTLLTETAAILTRLFDVTAAKDFANCHAVADVVVDGKVLVTKVPATYLLFLEKQLIDLHTVVKKLPVLDAGEEWHFDDAQDCYASTPTETTRTKKIPRNHVKAEATDKHPAQVELYHEDVLVGYWRTQKLSGALKAADVTAMVERVEKLQQAVKFAREEANTTDAPDQKIGDKIFHYLFSG